MSVKTDIDFLEEMKSHLKNAANDPTELEYVKKMVDDWIDELKKD